MLYAFKSNLIHQLPSVCIIASINRCGHMTYHVKQSQSPLIRKMATNGVERGDSVNGINEMECSITIAEDIIWIKNDLEHLDSQHHHHQSISAPSLSNEDGVTTYTRGVVDWCRVDLSLIGRHDLQVVNMTACLLPPMQFTTAILHTK